MQAVEFNASFLKFFITGGIDKSYENKFQKLNLLNTKIFKKAELEDHELISLISESICFIQLSIYEGFGITILESRFRHPNYY